MAEICKSDELRLRTERQLHQLIDHEVDLGIREAQQALSFDSWAFAKPHYIKAYRASARASRLMRLVDEVSLEQRDRWEGRLGHLREMLDGLSLVAEKPVPTSDNIASLARAFWDARGCPEGSPDDDWLRAERTLKSQSALCC
jgi:Protein of unknown function (DUF2934)